jgi:hypothetical protein
MMCGAAGFDESLLSDALASHRKNSTGSFGQNAVAEGLNLGTDEYPVAAGQCVSCSICAIGNKLLQ